jgi:hypothetical protein
MCLWWVVEGEPPTIESALERLEHIRAHGPSPHAFTFKRPFDPDGAPVDAASLRPLAGCP